MVEYIEKDALLKDLKDKCDYALSEYCWSADYTMGFERAMDIVSKALPLNVAIVKHGRWLDNKDYVLCSECGALWNYYDNDTRNFKYCPACGARMDGDD